MGPLVATISRHYSPSSAESSFRELDDGFLQTQTRIWLGEALHARLDEQLNIADLLADGELLFEVSKVIWNMLLEKCVVPRNVKAHKHKPGGPRKISGRYMPYSNVDSFLKICRILGLNGIDFFSPSDVVEKRDVRQVCICIRSLSKKCRSMHLDVPDFDLVTYTVAMPTDFVGCIRRNLELSCCSYTSSSSYSSNQDSRSKFRQKNLVAASEREYDSSSEESDEAESKYRGAESYSSSPKNSDNNAAPNSDTDCSAGVYSISKKYTFAKSVRHSGIQDHEIDGVNDGQCKSASITKSVKSLSLQNDYHQLNSMSTRHKKSQIKLCDIAPHANNGVKYSHQNGILKHVDIGLGLENEDSFLEEEDSFHDNIPEGTPNSHHLAFSDLVVLGNDGNHPVLFDEDKMFNLFTDTDSHGSSSTHRFSRNEFRRIFSDDSADVEVSSTTSMNSVLGRLLNLEFDDRFDSEDFRNTKVNFTDLRNIEADNLDKISVIGYESQDAAKYGTPAHGLIPDIEEPQFDMKLEKFDCSTNEWQSCAMEYQEIESFLNDFGTSPRDSADDNKAGIGADMFKSTPVIKGHGNDYTTADCYSNNVDIICEDSNASFDTVSVKGNERCNSNLRQQSVIIRDVHNLGMYKPQMVFADNTVFAAEKHPCSTIKVSDHVSKVGHQAFVGHDEDLIYCAGYTNEVIIKDEGMSGTKYENTDILAEVSDDKKEKSGRFPQGKPHRRTLLGTVAKSTALVGVLFVLLHLRSRNSRRGERGEGNNQSGQIQKSNGVKFSSRMAQKGDGVNGVYPTGKLKF